jgi:EmrB/QacA subfamily drug resistance transporter
MVDTARPAVTVTSPLDWSRKRKVVVTGGVMLGMFLAALEATVIGTAMPTIIASLGGLRIYSWAFSLYLLTQTITVPLWGRLSDMYGRKPFYLASIALFLMGSALSGTSRSMTQLIVFRGIQGLGAGGLIPLALTVIGEMYTLQQRAKMQGLFSGVWGFASITGPIVGGFLTDQVSWRWVFFINIPFGVLAAIVLAVGLQTLGERTRARPDYAGAALMSAAIALLLYTMLEGGRAAAWTSPRISGQLVAVAVLLGAFVLWERRAPEELLPLSLFRNPVVRAAIINGFLAGVAVFGVINYVPLFVQAVIGGSATAAGSVLTPMFLAWVVMSVIGGRLILVVGYRTTIIAGSVSLCAGSFLLSRLGETSSRADVFTAMAFLGCGMGLTMVTLIIAVQNAVPRAQMGVATSANMFFRQIGGALGVAVLGTVLSAGLQTRLAAAAMHDRALQAVARDPDAIVRGGGAGLSAGARHVLRTALASSLHGVFRATIIASALTLVAAFLVPKGKAEELAERYANTF